MFLVVAVTGFHQSFITGHLRYVVYAVSMGRRAAEGGVHTLTPVMHRLSQVVLVLGSGYMIWYHT